MLCLALHSHLFELSQRKSTVCTWIKPSRRSFIENTSLTQGRRYHILRLWLKLFQEESPVGITRNPDVTQYSSNCHTFKCLICVTAINISYRKSMTIWQKQNWNLEFNIFFLIIGDFAQVLKQTASSTGVAAPTSLISTVRCIIEDSNYQEVLSNQRETQVTLIKL